LGHVLFFIEVEELPLIFMPDPEEAPEDEETPITEPLGMLTEPAAQGQPAFATDPALASAPPMEPEDELDEPMLPEDDPPI
jgi:hypothetical protein